MIKKLKIIISMLCLMTLLSSTASFASAGNWPSIVPFADNYSSATAELSISSGTAKTTIYYQRKG